jgi:hypothetical protein
MTHEAFGSVLLSVFLFTATLYFMIRHILNSYVDYTKSPSVSKWLTQYFWDVDREEMSVRACMTELKSIRRST